MLSQRYGGSLGPRYGAVSATHLEYREARKCKKRTHFYIRDRLIADWTAWKKNGRRIDYVPTWAAKGEDAAGLFALVEEHQKLAGGADEPGDNNWYWQFRTSADFRADLRKRLEVEAYQATGERLVRAGQVPILLVVAQGLSTFAQVHAAGKHYYRFEFQIVNAGLVAAMSVQGDLRLVGGPIFGGNDARAGAVLPGNPGHPARIAFDVPDNFVSGMFGADASGQEAVICRLCFGYCTPSGHVMQDRFQLRLVRRGGDVQYECLPLYEGKTIIGMRHLLMTG